MAAGLYLFMVLVLSETGVSTCLLLRLIHTCEIFYKIMPFDKDMRPCLGNISHCIGGVARQSRLVRALRDNSPNVIVVDAGNYVEPNYWYAMFGTKILSDAVASIGYDAMSPALSELLLNTTKAKNVGPLMICANCAFHDRKHLIVQREGVKIGLIGFVSSKFMGWSQINSTDYKKIIREEIDNLTSQGVNIMILLSHSTLEENVEIADLFYELDVVVGGHGNTLLYNGVPPGNVVVTGPYPIVVADSRGINLVLATGMFGKFVGYLDLYFDDLGMLRKWAGNPIYVDDRFGPDPVLNDMYIKHYKDLELNFSMVVGSSYDFFDNTLCWYYQCPLAYRLCEALLEYIHEFSNIKMNMPASSQVCFTIGYFIRRPIKPGNITRFQLRDAFSFNLEYITVKLSGKSILDLLEKSAVNELDHRKRGTKLQTYGLRVTYNDLPNAKRKVKQVTVSKCLKCKFYAPLHEGKSYWVVMPKFFTIPAKQLHFLPYSLFDDILDLSTAGVTDMVAMEKYLSVRSPLYISSDSVFHGPRTRAPEWFPEMWLINKLSLVRVKFQAFYFSLLCIRFYDIWL